MLSKVAARSRVPLWCYDHGGSPLDTGLMGAVTGQHGGGIGVMKQMHKNHDEYYCGHCCSGGQIREEC